MVADTIIAVSSPAGNSLKGIIRLSGNRAFRLIKNTIDNKISARKSWQSIRCNLRIQLTNGLTDKPARIPVTLYLMPAPHSYTREDVVEIHTFGSKVLLEGILQYFIRKGARLAQPGEFTKRAFLNGRISLSQSEAVMTIIHSSTEREYRMAVTQLHQHSFRQLREINQQLFDLVSQLELALDFSDQEIEIITHKQIKDSLKRIVIGINKTLKESFSHYADKDGITCVLCGRPNTGKSSLFNCLVQDRRNIVSPIPGTTRDYIEGKILHKSTAFRIFDTAGINSPATRIPLPIRQADIYLLVINASTGLSNQDRAILKRLNPPKTIVVVNKIDLLHRNSIFRIPHSKFYSCSALTGKGIPALKNALVDMAQTVPPERSSDRTLINLRQQENLKSSMELLNKALSDAKKGASYEFIALDLKDALEQLGLALGGFSAGRNIVPDDILNNIFSRFCIGK